MKINKIILGSYFGLIVVFLLFLTTVGFIYKGKEVTHENKFETETILLGDYKHVNVGNGCNITVYSAQESKLVYSFNKEENVQAPLYEVKNDTLFILSTQNQPYKWINLRTENIESITCNNCTVNLQKVHQDQLKLVGEKSTIRITNQSKILASDITLKQNSDLQAWNYKGNSVQLDISASKAQFSSDNKLEVASGNLMNNSFLRLPVTNKIQIESDKSSEVKIF